MPTQDHISDGNEDKSMEVTIARNVLWAKSSPYMSVWTHSICTGICMEVFLSANSSKRIIDYFTDEFCIDCEDAINLVCYLASVHDIGKIHPAFQRKNKDCYDRLLYEMPEWFPPGQVDIDLPSFRHEYYSAAVLDRIWKAKGYSRDIRNSLSSIIALHHQKPKPNFQPGPRNKVWEEMQGMIENDLNSAFLRGTTLVLPHHTDAVCMLISSLIILMDWVASSEPFSFAEKMDEEEIRKKAEYILQLYGLIQDNLFPKIDSFEKMFPAITHPRPLQKACAELNDQALLTIIEAPMGEGKTEAAFYTAARLCNRDEARGIYMALPSQATSNQIHIRLNSLLSDLHYGDSRLLHGSAFLMQNLPDKYSTEDEATAAKWTRPSRMGLLGANAVGTVDQVMASVLRAKFGMVRLAGLSNKILIIDEIHAYDLYMSQIIEILLRWCHDLRIPVILLSATMQMAQKKRYLACFDIDEAREIDNSYPLITQVMANQELKQVSVDASAHYYYKMNPVRIEYDANRIAKAAADATAQGGCIAVMVNTVTHAQEIYDAIKQYANEDMTVRLFHSRFPLGRRAEIEKECISLFGRDRTHRPRRAVLIATQVVEQSIDLDFDGMFSELAPIDLLLQRAGRLHRHREYERPGLFQEPIMHIIMPPDTATDKLDQRFGPSGYVYDPFLLWNTEQQFPAERTVHIPEDIRDIIEAVYSTITDENRDAWMKRSLRGLLETSKAKGCTWPAPEQNTFFPAEATMYFDISDQDDGFETVSEVSTRLGENSVRIAFCDESLYDYIQENGVPPDKQIEIYMNSVSVRLKESSLNGSSNAFRVENGKLYGIWVLRGKDTVQLDNLMIQNDSEIGIRWR